MYTQRNVKWSDEDIDLLGITVSDDSKQSNMQYDNIIAKMESVIDTWSNRQLPLMGKILVINSLMGSLFVYAMLVLPPPSKAQIQKIDNMFNAYLWNKKKVKIPLRILRREKRYGGLRLVDIELRYAALQTKWVQKALEDEEFMYVSDLLCPEMGTDFWYCNLSERDVIANCPKTSWRDIRHNWAVLSFYEPKNVEEIGNQILWYNTCIKSGRKVWKPVEELRSHNVNKVKDILNKEGRVMTVREILEKNWYGK